jgi:putative effector of murein hydrolase
MSDQDSAAQRSAAVANATQALAVKELTDEIGGIRKQFKALWISVGVIGTITLILAILTILPRFGIRIGGGYAGRMGAGTTNGQQYNGGNGSGGSLQAPTTTGQ